MKHRYVTISFSFVEDTAFKLRTAASKCFPRFVSRPFPRCHLQELRATDPEQNAQHTPPADEVIDLYSGWAIEFYTPAHMEELISSFERLGWTEDDARNPAAWLKHREPSQYSQGWMHLGPVVPHNLPNTYAAHRLRADLPSAVSRAYGDMYWFTPSLLAIVFEFTFNEEYSRIYDDVLRQERQSYVTNSPKGFRIHNPSSQRDSHIKKIRNDSMRLITGWVSENIPGLFSAGLSGGDFPTCEFVTLRKAQPFPTREERAGANQWYLRNLGLHYSYGTWECTSMPSLRFNPSSIERNTSNYHSILSINEANWDEQDLQEANKSDRESRTYEMHRRVTGMLGVWATGILLRGYSQHFSKLRNSEFLRTTQGNSAEDALQKIRESVSYSVDIAAVTDELASLVQRKFQLGFDVKSFTPRSDAPDYWWKGSLEQLIQKQVGEDAEWLRSMENATRDQLTQYGTILGIVEDIRLRKKTTILTYVMLVLTTVLAIMTFITVSENFPWVKTLWNFLDDLL